MAIDLQARARLAAARQQRDLINGITSAVKPASDPDMDSLMGAPFKEVLRLAARKDSEKANAQMLGKIGQALAKIYTKIPGTIALPRIFPISGNVTARITEIPGITVKNFNEVIIAINSLEKRIGQMAAAMSMIAAQGPQEIK